MCFPPELFLKCTSNGEFSIAARSASFLRKLEQKRMRGDIIEYFKIITHKEDIDATQFFEENTTPHLRGHNRKVFKKQFRLDIRKHFFSQRVVSHWNNLPSYVIESTNVNMFKNRLDKYWHDMSIKIGPRA